MNRPRAESVSDALSVGPRAQTEELRKALREVVTNGEWRGVEWCISSDVYDMANDALSASPGSPRRPIAEAPRDGTAMMAWVNNNHGDNRPEFIWWLESHQCWILRDDGTEINEGWIQGWMPVPSFPSDPTPAWCQKEETEG